jgi:hypothetical protein
MTTRLFITIIQLSTHDTPFHFRIQFFGVWGDAVGKEDWNIFIKKCPEYLTKDFVMTHPSAVARGYLLFETKGVDQYVDRMETIMLKHKLKQIMDPPPKVSRILLSC